MLMFSLNAQPILTTFSYSIHLKMANIDLNVKVEEGKEVDNVKSPIIIDGSYRIEYIFSRIVNCIKSSHRKL